MRTGTGAKYRPRYESFLKESDNRFADISEIKAEAEPIRMRDLEKGRQTANGFPLLIEDDRIWVDSADHHNLIYGATGSGKTRRLILLMIRIMCQRGAEKEDSRICKKPRIQHYLSEYAGFFRREQVELFYGALPALSFRREAEGL